MDWSLKRTHLLTSFLSSMSNKFVSCFGWYLENAKDYAMNYIALIRYCLQDHEYEWLPHESDTLAEPISLLLGETCSCGFGVWGSCAIDFEKSDWSTTVVIVLSVICAEQYFMPDSAGKLSSFSPQTGCMNRFPGILQLVSLSVVSPKKEKQAAWLSFWFLNPQITCRTKNKFTSENIC